MRRKLLHVLPGTSSALVSPIIPTSFYHGRDLSSYPSFSPLHGNLFGHAPVASVSSGWGDMHATTILSVRKGGRVVSDNLSLIICPRRGISTPAV